MWVLYYYCRVHICSTNPIPMCHMPHESQSMPVLLLPSIEMVSFLFFFKIITEAETKYWHFLRLSSSFDATLPIAITAILQRFEHFNWNNLARAKTASLSGRCLRAARSSHSCAFTNLKSINATVSSHTNGILNQNNRLLFCCDKLNFGEIEEWLRRHRQKLLSTFSH